MQIITKTTVTQVEPTQIVYVPQPGVPRSPQEFRGLQAKRSDLSDQLVSVQRRRGELANELKSADNAARPGLQARIKVLDDRLVKLETELAITGEQIANTPLAVRGASTTEMPSRVANRLADEIVPITAILSVFVLAPLAFAFTRILWKRASAPARHPIDAGVQQQLAHLTQAVDTIAIEVERISEGQRFVTKVLNERSVEQIPGSISRS